MTKEKREAEWEEFYNLHLTVIKSSAAGKLSDLAQATEDISYYNNTTLLLFIAMEGQGSHWMLMRKWIFKRKYVGQQKIRKD